MIDLKSHDILIYFKKIKRSLGVDISPRTRGTLDFVSWDREHAGSLLYAPITKLMPPGAAVTAYRTTAGC
jgi:hypothetical protein